MNKEEEYAEEFKFLLTLRTSFPAEAVQTDLWVQERSLEGPHVWLESFADRTTEAILAGDAARVDAHTCFMAEAYEHGTAPIRSLIDVHYAGPLMWNADLEQKRWAWPFIAVPIRSLHEAMWGSPHR